MARSSGRAKPYVVEIQRHYHIDKLGRTARKGYPVSLPGNTSDHCLPHHVHAPYNTSSRLDLGFWEYEDIYSRRDSRMNSHFKQQGRWSFRDNPGTDKVREDTRRLSPGIARATEWRRQMNGDAGGYRVRNVDNEEIKDTAYQNSIDRNNGRMRASFKALRKTKNPKSIVTKDSHHNHNDDLELWIARQTSFRRKQDVMVERANLKILRNTAASRDTSRPPPVKPRPQTSRPVSSASSLRSGVISNGSHHSAKSAASEVSVKSILKKPNLGHVVLKEEPSSYTLCALLSCILCFPFGIYALVKSKQVKDAMDENDYEGALASSRKVKHFCIGVCLAYVVLTVVAGALLAVYFMTGKIF